MRLGTLRIGWLVATLLVVAIGAAAVACGSDEEPEPAPAATPAAAPEPQAEPEPEAEAEAEAEAAAAAAAAEAEAEAEAEAAAAEAEAEAEAAAAEAEAAAAAAEAEAEAEAAAEAEAEAEAAAEAEAEAEAAAEAEAESEPEPEQVATLDDFVIDETTTGEELMNRLSEDERNCVRGVFGEAVYNFMLATPLLATPTDPAAAAPLFNCLTPENSALFGVAMADVAAGGWTPETRSCIVAITKAYPEVMLVRFGLAIEGSAADANARSLEVYECMTDAEKMTFTLSFWLGVDSTSAMRGSDIVALLTESEAACLSETIPEDQFQVMLDATPLAATAIGSMAAECISPQSTLAIFGAGMDSVIGPLSEESINCTLDFALANPEFVALLATGLANVSDMDPAEFVRITDVGTAQYACLTDEELARVQEAAATGMAAISN